MSLEEEINRVYDSIDSDWVGTDVYSKKLDHLERLYRLNNPNECGHKSIDPNVIISTLGSIACVLLIASFEQDGIFPTKCFPFIPKGRA